MATRYEFTADGPRPVLPPVHRRAGETSRAAAAPTHPHEVLSIVHSHPHSSYSTGAPEHDHMHSHFGDASHDHSHASAHAMPAAPMSTPGVTVSQMNSAGFDLIEIAGRFLEAAGADVPQLMREVEYDRQDQAHATRAEAGRLRDLALALKRHATTSTPR